MSRVQGDVDSSLVDEVVRGTSESCTVFIFRAQVTKMEAAGPIRLHDRCYDMNWVLPENPTDTRVIKKFPRYRAGKSPSAVPTNKNSSPLKCHHLPSTPRSFKRSLSFRSLRRRGIYFHITSAQYFLVILNVGSFWCKMPGTEYSWDADIWQLHSAPECFSLMWLSLSRYTDIML